MFRAVISRTQMTSEAANNFFQHITGEAWSGDFSFLSTLRALIAPRMQEDERLYVGFTNSNYSASQVASTSANRVVRSVIDLAHVKPGSIIIHNFAGRTQEDNYACLELMKSTFCEVYPGWHQLGKVTELFRKTFYVLCFINPETKSVVIFTDNMDIRKMHYLQCSILGFLPWYFDPNDGVSEEEMKLIQSLREKTSNQYEDCIVKFAEKYDFKTMHIRRLLADFETRFERQECEKIRSEIREIDRTIDNYSKEISNYLVCRRGSEVRLLGLQIKIESGNGESEIMDYFLANQKLVLDSANDSAMVFVVKDYLTYFNEDMAKTIIENPDSYVYVPDGRRCNNYIQAEDMKRLMCAIFVDQTLRIKFCAAYRFDIRNQSVVALDGFDYGPEFREYMPNTHIDRFRCLGSHEVAINTNLRNNDYIGAIEQCVASCKSLNFGDSTVMAEFMRRMYGLQGHTNVNNRCIELPDGSILTAKEAADWLKLNEESKK